LRDMTWGFDGDKPWDHMTRVGAPGTYTIYKPGSIRRGFQPEYLVWIGLCYPDPTAEEELQKAAKEKNFLPEMFKSGDYRVRRGVEKVDGARCVVLEAGGTLPGADKEKVDRLWLDLEHGLALRRRDFVEGAAWSSVTSTRISKRSCRGTGCP